MKLGILTYGSITKTQQLINYLLERHSNITIMHKSVDIYFINHNSYEIRNMFNNGVQSVILASWIENPHRIEHRRIIHTPYDRLEYPTIEELIQLDSLFREMNEKSE